VFSLPPAFNKISCLSYSLTLKMETCCSETSVGLDGVMS
jgi:hypothetical protein